MHMFNTDGVIYDKELEEHHNKMCPYSEQESKREKPFKKHDLVIVFC